MSRGQDSTFFVAFLTALIVSIGTTLVMYIFVLPRIPMPQMQAAGRVTSPPRPTVAVPPVVGLPLTDASAAVVNAGLRMSFGGQLYDAKQPAGYILSQIPSASERVSPKSEIRVVVSLGPPVGVGAMLPTPPPTAPKTRTRSQPKITPPPPPSDVKAATSVKVPNLQGKHINRAKKKLQELGLNVKVSYGDDEDVAPNMVLKQRPSSGTIVPIGETVHLEINK